MKIVSLVILNAFVVGGLAGCSTMSNVSSNYVIPQDDQSSVVIIGVSPEYRVAIQKGEINNDVFEQNGSTFFDANLYPENGYIVVKLRSTKNNEEYAIPQVMPDGINGAAWSGILFRACKGTLVPTFTLKKGQAMYVGDLIYKKVDSTTLLYTKTMNIDSAKEFITKNFPKLKFTAAEMNLLPMGDVECDGAALHKNIYQPTYVPAF